MGQALQSVPVFTFGTSVQQVRDELINRNLRILVEWPGYMVVREGVPLIDLSGPVRENYLYGFENDELALGPKTFTQVQSEFVTAGLTSDRMQILHMFANIESDNPSAYVNYAWLLATCPDSRYRDGELAIEFAERALAVDELPDWRYVETLAAAYATAGDFDYAVQQQRRAIALSNVSDESAARRLQLYKDGKIYVSSIVELEVETRQDASEDDAPTPKAGLLREAAAGSANAQWTLASFYIENHIDESDGMMAPGVFWMQQAAMGGYPLAANEVGYCYLMSRCGVVQDWGLAVRWFQMGVDDGDVTAAFNLGRMLEYGHGAPRDDAETTRLLTIAADSGINAAAFNVAFRYRQGLGTPPDYAAQKKYLQQIESAGYGPADYLLDDAYFQRFMGAAVVAAQLDRMAIKPREMANAQMNIVDILMDAYEAGGDVLPVQFADGATFEFSSDYGPYLIFNLIRISASLGSKRAQLLMAEYYEQGDIVPRSLVEAHYWRQRAEQ